MTEKMLRGYVRGALSIFLMGYVGLILFAQDLITPMVSSMMGTLAFVWVLLWILEPIIELRNEFAAAQMDRMRAEVKIYERILALESQLKARDE